MSRTGIKIIFCLFFIFICACTKTFSKTTTQANPIFYASNPDYIKESEKLKIVRGDHELRNYKLASYAKFVVVSRDRINFRVEFTHKWSEYADPCTWDMYVKIDGGKYKLECDSRNPKQITWMWDEQRREVLARDLYGDPILIDAYEKPPGPLKSMTVFVGKAGLTVYHRDIISTDTKKIELVLEKKQTRFIYTWNLEKPTDEE